jgi:hypothetical protein
MKYLAATMTAAWVLFYSTILIAITVALAVLA